MRFEAGVGRIANPLDSRKGGCARGFCEQEHHFLFWTGYAPLEFQNELGCPLGMGGFREPLEVNHCPANLTAPGYVEGDFLVVHAGELSGEKVCPLPENCL